MGFIQGTEGIAPADDACEEDGEFCDNCGKYIGEEQYRKLGGLCYQCREPL